MKKKKFLALLLTGAMALAALTGCSSGTETTEESTGGDASAESGDGAYKIALIQQHQTNAFQIGVTEGAQAKADELGVELNILSADQDAAKQISQIEQCCSYPQNKTPVCLAPSCSSPWIPMACATPLRPLPTPASS